jgi:heat shock protein HslJ
VGDPAIEVHPARRTLCLAVAGALAACAAPPLLGVHTPMLTGIDWWLVELDGKPVARERAPDGRLAPPPQLRLDHDTGRAGGSTGVNAFTGSFQQTGDTLRFGSLAATRRTGPPPAMAIESAYLQALQATVAARVDDAGLVLLDTQARVLARLTPAPRP